MKLNSKKITYFCSILLLIFCIGFCCSCSKVSTTSELTGSTTSELTAEDIYKKCNPNICFILIETGEGYQSGTGFFIDDKGTFITNYHVIDEGIDGSVKTENGTVADISKILGYDKEKDIAILSTNNLITSPIDIDYNYDVEVGESVYALGYPMAFSLGTIESTFTNGMVSKRIFFDKQSKLHSIFC